mgnify:CR=1 FL=1
MKIKQFFMMAVMSLGLMFTSCGSVDNPLEEIVNTVAEQTGYSPEQITALLEEAMSTEAVQEAIANQTPITVNIYSGNTSSSDKTITIPMEVPVGGKKLTVELNFKEAYETSETNPLVIKADEGSDDASGNSDNNLVISMPASTGLVINIELPKTTVTLKTDGSGQVVYKSVTAKTASQTLIVGNDVTIEELDPEGGIVQVMDGGKIETYVYPVGKELQWELLYNNVTSLNSGRVKLKVKDEGVEPINWDTNVGTDESPDPRTRYEISKYVSENDDQAYETPYYCPKLKITKGNGDYAYLEFVNDNSSPLKKLTISDNAKVETSSLYAETVEGGSNAEVKFARAHSGSIEHDGIIYPVYYGICAENISNIDFSEPVCTDAADLTGGTIEKYIRLNIPCQTEEKPSYTITFDGCKFNENIKLLWQIMTISEGVYSLEGTKYNITVTFKNCTYGDSPLTADCIFTQSLKIFPPEDVNLLFNFGGNQNYKFKNVAEGWAFEAVE